ncbi:MAG: hypothetical protein IFJ96_03965 [Acidobacteria bacterium]|nr:hypothetical protein [Candidatus Sulfomarinibacter sp. MAG AM2]
MPIAHVETGGPPSPVARHLLDANWEDPTSETLMLYLADEPRIGDEFPYHGLRWMIVDYRNGWVARLLVD